jgi:hypothetical protein
MAEEETPETPPERDAAADAGRAAGRAASVLTRRMLRFGPLREAIKRGVEEAKEPAAPEESSEK